ncbi:hypothetical protein B0H11DRAFT_2035495 [Mycena galericulata]|nr:hypothetical protein B0H11DRAFT_2035495 [Mycena galericulata]
MTIQSIQNGEVGSPKSSSSPRSAPSPASTATALDIAAAEYDTVLLRRNAVVLHHIGVDPANLDASVLRGIQPQVQQLQPLNAAQQSLLGILSPAGHVGPGSFFFDAAEHPTTFGECAAILSDHPARTDSYLPNTHDARPSQFSQLFPEGMCAPGQAPLLSMADYIYQTIVRAQEASDAVEIMQPRWDRVYNTIQRPPPDRCASKASRSAEEVQERARAQQVTVPRPPLLNSTSPSHSSSAPVCPLGVRLHPPVVEQGSVVGASDRNSATANVSSSSPQAHDTLTLPGPIQRIDRRPPMVVQRLRQAQVDFASNRHEKSMKPSEACVTAMEERQRGIFGEIMNGQYVRRRGSDYTTRGT